MCEHNIFDKSEYAHLKWHLDSDRAAAADKIWLMTMENDSQRHNELCVHILNEFVNDAVYAM